MQQSRASRRSTQAVKVGSITVGGGAPIAVQSMTNTDTADIDATVRQIAELAGAGSEMVRFTVDREDAARAHWVFLQDKGPRSMAASEMLEIARAISPETWARRAWGAGARPDELDRPLW